jgi:tetraacyldisaccharide 4'-kinase
VERWLQSFWYGPRPVPVWLLPLAALFGLLMRLRGAAYARGWLPSMRLPVPVIVIGNLSVGGTGKTPLTVWLVQQLQTRGLRVGVVLRGYGGAARRPQLVAEGSTADEVGDEALLIRAQAHCPVAVGADRVAAARLLLAQDVQLIIADDGLQHLRLRRDVEIVVADGERGFGNGRLLPAGPLREPSARAARLSLRIQNGGTTLLWPDARRMRLEGHELRPVGRAAAAVPVARLAGQQVHAVAGIGHPQRFFASLRALGLAVIEHAFPDHHRYRPGELEFGDALPVLMTEKDAVKCHGFALAHHWYLPVAAHFDAADQRRILEKIFMDARLLDILACPVCKGPLQYLREQSQLLCRADRLAFPIRDGVPVMIEEEARALPADDPLLER